MKLFCHAFAALCLLVASAGLTAAQAATQWSGRAEGQLRLLAGERASDGSYAAGLEMQLQEGWHTYWRVAGASGIAPSFDWSASKNVARVDVSWPAPERFEAEDDTTYGFEHHLVWPLRVTPQDPEKPVELKLSAFYGICADLCVPAQAQLALALTPDTSPPANDVAAITAAIAALPPRLSSVPVQSGRVQAWWKAGTPSLLMIELATMPNEDPLLEVKTPPGMSAGFIDMNEEPGRRIFILPLDVASGAKVSGAHITLSISGAHTSIQEEVILP